jgi:hypothetical protein
MNERTPGHRAMADRAIPKELGTPTQIRLAAHGLGPFLSGSYGGEGQNRQYRSTQCQLESDSFHGLRPLATCPVSRVPALSRAIRLAPSDPYHRPFRQRTRAPAGIRRSAECCVAGFSGYGHGSTSDKTAPACVNIVIGQWIRMAIDDENPFGHRYRPQRLYLHSAVLCGQANQDFYSWARGCGDGGFRTLVPATSNAAKTETTRTTSGQPRPREARRMAMGNSASGS